MKICLSTLLLLACTLGRGQSNDTNVFASLPSEARTNSTTLFAAPTLTLGEPGSRSTLGRPGSTPASPNTCVADDKYKLRPGDRVAFQVLEDKDAPKSLVVADSGELDVPYLGRVSAVDKTCKELAAELKKLLEKEYYIRATVVLAVDVANKFIGRVYVWGQVRNQGPVDFGLGENLTAGKAILRAGGFADFANKKRVKIVRALPDATGKQTFELNLADILERGHPEKDIPLQPDDFIIVPSRLINL